MRYLLDSNVISQLVRDSHGEVARRLLQQVEDEVYASIRAELESRGTPIRANDLLIAAHAISLDATLVTDNTAEFRRVPNLRVENWLRQD